jgi:hypothetical protein
VQECRVGTGQHHLGLGQLEHEAFNGCLQSVWQNAHVPLNRQARLLPRLSCSLAHTVFTTRRLFFTSWFAADLVCPNLLLRLHWYYWGRYRQSGIIVYLCEVFDNLNNGWNLRTIIRVCSECWMWIQSMVVWWLLCGSLLAMAGRERWGDGGTMC